MPAHLAALWPIEQQNKGENTTVTSQGQQKVKDVENRAMMNLRELFLNVSCADRAPGA